MLKRLLLLGSLTLLLGVTFRSGFYENPNQPQLCRHCYA